LKNNSVEIAHYLKGIRDGDISILSRAITLIESTNPDHRVQATELINVCLPFTGNSFRLGITGVPGVGKSTFIESFGCLLADQKNKVAVLAVDPSSQLSKGSILGDKTRMEKLSVHPNVFIRPTPASGNLGGVADRTRETILLFEAAGYNYILVETVGVGQSETEVRNLTDFFLLLMLAGAGDELQGIKRGIMEMADAVVITKADGINIDKAKVARSEFTHAIHLFPASESGWIPEVLSCSAVEGKGISEIILMIEKYKRLVISNGYLDHNRNTQKIHWFRQLILERLKHDFFSNPSTAAKIADFEKEIVEKNSNPYSLFSKLFS